MAFIRANFGALIPALKSLQTQGLSISDVAQILRDVKDSLDGTPGEIGTKIQKKFDDVLARNPGFQKIRQIGMILSGAAVENFTMSPTLVALYKFCPLTSCDVERSFSIYKNFLTDRRTGFTKENIEKYLICRCASDNDPDHDYN